MLMISVTILSALVVTVGFNSAAGFIGMVKSYGPAIGSPQPYETTGPFVDGIAYPQFLITQDGEWTALKSGGIDVYDFAMTAAQLNEYNSNICVAGPDAPGGLGGCPANQAPIQHEIGIQTLRALDKWELDFQVQLFPSNVLAFRQAIAWITDKQNFTTNFLAGLGVPIYTTMPAGLSNVWVKAPYLTCATAPAPGTCYGAGLPISQRIAVANAILNNAGFTIGTNFRENHRSTCASDPGGCGALLKPFFYVRSDDVNRLSLGRFIRNIMAGTGTSGLSIQMVSGCTNSGYPSAQNYCETTRASLRPAVFGANNFNMYTGGWSLTRDPTFVNIYDPLGIFPFGTNYNRYNDPVFTQAERGLTTAPSQSTAQTFAYALEDEYNATLPALDVWSTQAPYAYRIYHSDSDATLNGLQWSGISVLLGTGWNNGFSFLNAQLIGAPVHNPAHPVFIKYGIKTDVLDAPNPITTQFLYDFETYSSSYDFLNALANDDLGFSGDLPNMASIPVVTSNVANGAAFPDGSICTPDNPASGCQVLTIQLRPDLSWAASLDGAIPSLPVTVDDVQFSTLLARDDPGSFISASYFDLQNVLTHNSHPSVVTNPNAVVFEFRTQAVWNRHYVGGTPVESLQHWCVEAHGGSGGPAATPGWPGTTNPGVDCRPVSSCVLSGTNFNANGVYSCPWPQAPSGCTTCNWPDQGVSVTSSGTQNSINQQSFVPGNPVGTDLGSFAFVYDSKNSFTGGTNGPMVFRTREPGMTWPGYSGFSPEDGYFTNDPDFGLSTFSATAATVSVTDGGKTINCTLTRGATVSVNCTSAPTCSPNPLTVAVPGSAFCRFPHRVFYIGFNSDGSGVATLQKQGGWHKFHLAGNINWYCTTGCPGGNTEVGPLPSDDMVINIVDLSLVAAHFGQTPGVGGSFGAGHFGVAAWDVSGQSGSPDGSIDIFDLTRVALHFGQSFLGGTDQGGGTEGSIPGWVFEDIPGT